MDERTCATTSTLNVLIVDDNADAARMFAMLLEIEGHDARTVYSGPEAIEAVESFTPDAVFLDIGLPLMNGYEVAEKLRRVPALQKTLLVAMTGFDEDDQIERSRQAGFHHHVVKPADPGVVQNLLAEAANRR